MSPLSCRSSNGNTGTVLRLHEAEPQVVHDNSAGRHNPATLTVSYVSKPRGTLLALLRSCEPNPVLQRAGDRVVRAEEAASR